MLIWKRLIGSLGKGVCELIERISIVLANWCPHCIPLSLNNAERMTEIFGAPLRVLDIDLPKQLDEADDLVRNYGDWCEDYLIPQVFLEYDNGEARHVFTGFSEAVSVTATGWNYLLSFIERFKGFKRERAKEGSSYKSLTDFVEKYLTFKGRCRRHCNQFTSLVKLSSSRERFTGAYLCQRGFVSTVVYFSKEADIKGFTNFLENQLGKGVVRGRDLRVATRYGWELKNRAFLDMGDVSHDGFIKEVYWTVYPRTEVEQNWGVFFCQDWRRKKGCGRLFLQVINSKNSLCPKCVQ